MFEQADFDLIEEIGRVLRRFEEVNTFLMDADNQEGLASVFQAINAIYMTLKGVAEKEGACQAAYIRAVKQIEERFFNLSSKFCCRLIELEATEATL